MSLITAVILLGLVIVDTVESFRLFLVARLFCLFGNPTLCLELRSRMRAPMVNLNHTLHPKAPNR